MSSTQVETSGASEMMKAVNYQGAFKVKVEEVPKPKIEHPDDVIVKITTSGGLSLPFLRGCCHCEAKLTADLGDSYLRI